jgi:UDP-GlcNAc:undecaprenyl-phosphate GlcNAc-1-phosphate transferase
VILVLTGTEIAIFENESLNTFLSILWVVGIMNSINMLDNMDGIAAIVTGFILISCLFYLGFSGDIGSASFMLILGILASLCGFLFYNWNPSIMYMGDTGSQFIGVILGYVGIHYCWNAEFVEASGYGWHGIAALLVVFLLPIADTTVVTINRIRKGQSPFVGGRDHTTHNLSYRGFSDHQVALIFVFLSILSLAFYLILIKFANPLNPTGLILCILYFLIVFGTLFGITELNKRTGKLSEQNSKT